MKMQERPVVLFTGTRRDLTLKEREIIQQDFEMFVAPGSIVLHGQCPTGVDDYVDELCKEAEVFFSRSPAPWKKFRRRAGRLRNEYMAYQLSLYLQAKHRCTVLGYPSSEGSGTQHMLELARELNEPGGLYVVTKPGGISIMMREFD